jgi:hypothetical protein
MKRISILAASLMLVAVFAVAPRALAATTAKSDAAKSDRDNPSAAALAALGSVPAARPADALLKGFVLQPLICKLQRPYDLAPEKRYLYDKESNTDVLWIHQTDKAHQPKNTTEPRTEFRLPTYVPNSGLHMIDCDMFIVPGSFACITQVFGTGPNIIIIANAQGSIQVLGGGSIDAKNLEGRWFHWTVIHDPQATAAGAVKVYIDGRLAGQLPSKRNSSYYLKCGLYARKGSDRSEILIHDLKYLIKPPPGAAAPAPVAAPGPRTIIEEDFSRKE